MGPSTSSVCAIYLYSPCGRTTPDSFVAAGFDGVGRRWLVAILLSSRQSLDPGDGYGWVYSLAAFATNLVHLLFITELAGQ